MLRPAFFAACLVLFAAVPPAAAQSLTQQYGKLEVDQKSDFSHIRIRTKGDIRTLFFVRDSGEEAVESKVDLKKPDRLLIDYTKHMFMSYAFQPKQERVVVVGLGGGAMIHWLKHHDPDLIVDAVEIDPVVVKLAETHFNVKSEGNVNVITADGIKYLAETEQAYDVIYMDAFLKPSGETDVNGVPLKLKTADFHKLIQEKLAPGGMVVFNLNPHVGTREDVAEIARSFGQTYIFRLTDSYGLVAVATPDKSRVPAGTILKNAKALDTRFKATFKFENMAGRLIRQ
jgi:spermidine synthase